jgi:hypothetical protein
VPSTVPGPSYTKRPRAARNLGKIGALVTRLAERPSRGAAMVAPWSHGAAVFVVRGHGGGYWVITLEEYQGPTNAIWKPSRLSSRTAMARSPGLKFSAAKSSSILWDGISRS